MGPLIDMDNAMGGSSTFRSKLLPRVGRWKDSKRSQGSLEEPALPVGVEEEQNAEAPTDKLTKENSKPSKRLEEIAFATNDDLPDPVLYADGCVDDNKIIMLCQRQEMERL